MREHPDAGENAALRIPIERPQQQRGDQRVAGADGRQLQR